ncbi:MAG: S-layer homology domain-containing protein [Bacillota bacterium]
MKKFWVFLVSLAFLLGVGNQNALADDGLDGEQFRVPMRELVELGIMEGELVNGTIDYGHDETINRAEFAIFMVRILGEQDAPVTKPLNFKDVPKNSWYYKPIQQIAQLGIVNGTSATTFSPKENITREQIAAIMDKVIARQGVVLPKGDLSSYKDADKVSSYFKEAMERIVGAGILSGSNNQLNPKGYATRGMTSAFLNRMMKHTKPVYYIGTVTADKLEQGKKYASFDAAKDAATGENQVVTKYKKIVSMKSGQVTSSINSPIVELFNAPNFHHTIIGVASGTPVEFLESDEDWIKAKFGEKVGYIKSSEAFLIPAVQVKGDSYYEVKNGLLYHYVYNAREQKYDIPYLYGRSDADMPTGKYSSKNGSVYTNLANGKNVEANQYFNKLPLYTKTSYTAEELNAYVKKNRPNSVLATLGEEFKAAEQEHHINAMYILAHAIHESDWGMHPDSLKYKNLFGIGAVDGSGKTDEFDSYEENINALVAELTNPTNGYLTKSDFKQQGEFLGNKDMGMNVFYAADPYWGQKIAGHMHRMDVELGGKERNKYNIAITLTKGVPTNVRSLPSVTGDNLYGLTPTGTTVLILDTIKTDNEGIWYKIAPKNYERIHSEAYVYSHGGPHGTNMKVLKLAKE